MRRDSGVDVAVPRILVIVSDVESVVAYGPLLHAGYEVQTAMSAAIALVVASSADFDLLVLDVNPRDTNGIGLLRRLRYAGVAAPCIVISAAASFQAAVDALRLGARDFLVKPLSDVDLVRAAAQIVVPRAAVETVGRDRGLAERTIEIVNAGFREPRLTLRAVADQLHVSAEHLCRCFRKATGRGFSAYLDSVRLRCAQGLLRNGNASVKEIAFLAGFGSTTRLDRRFKKHFGTLPSTYRRQA
jgi:two-component system response regulator YesN